MPNQPAWRRYVRFWGPDIEQDTEDELSFHFEMLVREYRERGLSEMEARRAAEQRFGNYAVYADTCNEIGEETERMFRRREWFGRLWQDIRFALRQLRARPAISITALLTLALGIGANTAIFGVVNAVLLRPLPYPNAERLVVSGMSLPEYHELRQRNRSFEDLTGWASNQYTVRDTENPEQIFGGIVYPNFFDILGGPVIGRAISAEDEQSAVAVISHSLWQRRYGGEQSVLGRSINLNGTPHQIIGVLPRTFAYPSANFDVWVPLVYAMKATPAQLENRSLRIFRIVARLRPAATLEQAQADLRGFSEQLQLEHPQTNQGLVFEVAPLADLLVGGVRRALFVVLGAVGLVLLIACVNVANLLLGSTSARSRELAVRRALGAPRGRLVRQLLTESFVLAFLGSAAGLLLARTMLRALPSVTSNLPRMSEIGIDPRVLLFTLAATVLTTVLFGMIPALQGSRGDLNEVLKEGGRSAVGSRRGGKLRASLIAAEVAISVVVVVGAGLLIQSLTRVLNQDIGFDPERLVSANVGLFYFTDADQRAQVLDQVLERVRVLPGVESVAGGSALPPQSAQRGTGFWVLGRAADEAERNGAYWVAITPSYFSALGTPVVRGRAFAPSDDRNAARVVIINESLARTLFPDGNAIGRQMELTNAEAGAGLRTIVGVVGDVRYSGIENPTVSVVYTPFAQTPFLWSNLMVRTSAPAEQIARPLRQAIGGIDARIAPARVQQHGEVVSQLVEQRRFITLLLGGFAALALTLAAIGIYGVIAYTVVLRSKEIGVRMALGANPGLVLAQVIGRAVRMVAIGLVVGLVAAFWLTRLLASLLYDVGATDPVTFALAAGVMLVTALAASAVPASRAARVDPLLTLRD